MEQLDAIKLEGVEYAIIHEQEINGTTYVYLVGVENPKDFGIRKIVVENGKEMLDGLDSDEEFDLAFRAFAEKISNI